MKKHEMNALLGSMLIIGTIALGSAVRASEEGLTGNVNILYGDKFLSDADWNPVETQEEFGIELDIARKDWPAFLTVAYSRSEEKDNSFFTTKGETQSLDFGVKKIWSAVGGFRPFLGTGLSYVRGKATIDDFDNGLFVVQGGSDSGSGLGYWASGGFGFLIGERFNVGARLKWSMSRLDFGDDVTIMGGGLHTGVFAGIHF
jgi:hypothetical protein